jgi:hypothetical protein
MRFPRNPQPVPTTLDWPDTVFASTARSIKAIQASDLYDVSDFAFGSSSMPLPRERGRRKLTLERSVNPNPSSRRISRSSKQESRKKVSESGPVSDHVTRCPSVPMSISDSALMYRPVPVPRRPRQSDRPRHRAGQGARSGGVQRGGWQGRGGREVGGGEGDGEDLRSMRPARNDEVDRAGCEVSFGLRECRSLSGVLLASRIGIGGMR